MIERVFLVCEARRYGIELKPGESTKALRYRLRHAAQGTLRHWSGSRRALEALTGGTVDPCSATGEVVITLPAGTSSERVAEVEALCLDHVPVYVVATVRVEGQS